MAAPTTARAIAQQKLPDRRLTLEEILRDLIADQLVTREAADALLATKALRKGDAHPLIVVADQKWKDPRHPKRLLTLDPLSEWLAGKVDLPYLHIDPFKIDFAAVTKVMSNAYATRFKILPIGATTREAVIDAAMVHFLHSRRIDVQALAAETGVSRATIA
jgi:general secretion pathway protein E